MNKLVPVEKLIAFNIRKKRFLGLPLGKVSIVTGGRDHFRELIRMRDKHTCQKCKKKWIEGERRFDVHHLEESMLGKNRMRGVVKYDKENMDKLITFCHKCHFHWHMEKGHNIGKRKRQQEEAFSLPIETIIS